MIRSSRGDAPTLSVVDTPAADTPAADTPAADTPAAVVELPNTGAASDLIIWLAIISLANGLFLYWLVCSRNPAPSTD